ncbi:hypothetical protein P3T18_002858 [Paraburkholderia sp. GAS199]|uniref:hypothetical protein n=1 Tax=Paraburkholderia sp. GAS199 TaxID=3035126 RepID=UPI003D1BEAEE
MCNWAIDADGLQLAANETSNTVIDKALRFLDGQKLESIEVTRKDMKTIFQFDLGGKLSTWPYSDQEVRCDAQWILYDYGAKLTRALKGDGTWLCETLPD